jgi:hypothetical protein
MHRLVQDLCQGCPSTAASSVKSSVLKQEQQSTRLRSIPSGHQISSLDWDDALMCSGLPHHQQCPGKENFDLEIMGLHSGRQIDAMNP